MDSNVEGSVSEPEGTNPDFSNQRDSFNKAYSSLEQTIRNFSKEKLQYEQEIENLSNQLQITKVLVQNLNSEKQEQSAERQKLTVMLNESSNDRERFSELLQCLEVKLQVLQEALEQYGEFEKNVSARYEGHEEFVYCLKPRQLQLLRALEESIMKNREFEVMQKDLVAELAKVTDELNGTIRRYEIQAADHLREKDRIVTEHQSENDSATAAITAIREEKGKLEEEFAEASRRFEDQKKSFNEEITTLTGQLQGTKTCLEMKISQLEADKLMLSGENENIFKQVGELKAQLEEETQKAGNEKKELEEELKTIKLQGEKQLAEFSETKSSLLKELNESKANFEALSLKSSEESKALLDVVENMKLEVKEKEAAFADEKGAFEKKLRDQTEKYEEEKASLISDHQSALDHLNNEAETHKKEFQELMLRYQDQKKAITKLVEETGIRTPVSFSQTKGSVANSLKAKIQPSVKASSSDSNSEMIRPIPRIQMTPMKSKEATISPAVAVTPANQTPRYERPKALSPRISILKRSTSTYPRKSVSFGPTSINDFIISSSSDTDSVSENSPKSGKIDEAVGGTGEKRFKVSDENNGKENKEDSDSDYMPHSGSKPSLKRHYRRIPKTPSRASASDRH